VGEGKAVGHPTRIRYQLIGMDFGRQGDYSGTLFFGPIGSSFVKTPGKESPSVSDKRRVEAS
jgi:hypothetical protein